HRRPRAGQGLEDRRPRTGRVADRQARPDRPASGRARVFPRRAIRRVHRQSQPEQEPMKTTILAIVISAFAISDPGTGDWPMWGGTPDRNMVSSAKGLPTEWDIKTKKNVKWMAELGSQSYGNPVVAGGMVFVGTN